MIKKSAMKNDMLLRAKQQHSQMSRKSSLIEDQVWKVVTDEYTTLGPQLKFTDWLWIIICIGDMACGKIFHNWHLLLN